MSFLEANCHCIDDNLRLWYSCDCPKQEVVHYVRRCLKTAGPISMPFDSQSLLLTLTLQRATFNTAFIIPDLRALSASRKHLRSERTDIIDNSYGYRYGTSMRIKNWVVTENKLHGVSSDEFSLRPCTMHVRGPSLPHIEGLGCGRGANYYFCRLLWERNLSSVCM